MKTSKIIILVLSSLVLLTVACNLPAALSRIETPAALVTEARRVTPFTQIVFTGGGKINIMQGNEYSLTIEASQSNLNDIKTEINGDRLVIKHTTPRLYNWSDHETTYTITVVDLTSFKMEGGADIKANDLTLESLALDFSGGASIDLLNLEVDTLTVKLAGGVDFETSGTAGVQDVNISGAANYQAEDLRSENVKLEISGAGNAKVWAIQTLDLVASGVYSVDYYGNPVVVQDLSGVGSIESLGVK